MVFLCIREAVLVFLGFSPIHGSQRKSAWKPVKNLRKGQDFLTFSILLHFFVKLEFSEEIRQLNIQVRTLLFRPDPYFSSIQETDHIDSGILTGTTKKARRTCAIPVIFSTCPQTFLCTGISSDFFRPLQSVYTFITLFQNLPSAENVLRTPGKAFILQPLYKALGAKFFIRKYFIHKYSIEKFFPKKPPYDTIEIIIKNHSLPKLLSGRL